MHARDLFIRYKIFFFFFWAPGTLVRVSFHFFFNDQLFHHETFARKNRKTYRFKTVKSRGRIRGRGEAHPAQGWSTELERGGRNGRWRGGGRANKTDLIKNGKGTKWIYGKICAQLDAVMNF